MPYDNRRPDRVAEAIREEVASFLTDGVKDPRVRGLVTVTAVDITRDLRHAKVFVSVLGDEAQKEETLVGLAAVASHLRGHVGRALRLRVAPEISFRADPSVARAARIETLLEQVRVERETGHASGDGDVIDAHAEAAAPSGTDATDADPAVERQTSAPTHPDAAPAS
jgi:ribosome-binding factor A